MKAIIAAGGKGTRLYPLTFTSNKHLIPIANKPLLLYPVEDIASVGIKEVGVIVNETKPAIENLLGNGSKWGLKITYIDQPVALGIGHVVMISETFLAGEPFVYHLGDNIFTNGIKKPFDYFAKEKPDAVLTIIEHPENHRLGVPFFDENGKLLKVVEKPQNPPNKYGVPGLYFFNHNVFKAFKGPDRVKPSERRGEYEVPDLYSWLIEHNYRVEAAEIDGEWRDPGKFDDSLDANRLLLDLKCKTNIKGKVDKATHITGEVEAGKRSVIKNSQIEGPVSIGENVYVENSQIKPHTSIANGCKVINSQIGYSIIMEDVTIENIRKPIDASMIGKHAVIRSDKAAKPTYNFTISDHSHIDVPF